MKKLVIVLISLCLITGCGAKDNNISDANANTTQHKTTSVNSTLSTTSNISTSISSTNTITTASSTSSTSSTSKGALTTNNTSKSTIKTTIKTTKKITTTERVTQVKVTTRKTTTSLKFKYTEEDVRNKILALKKKYPDGTSWTNENRTYNFKASNMTNYVGHGCAAFAFMASDEAFGTLPVKKIMNFDNIRTGDIIRYQYNTHSVIVLEVKGNQVIVAEGNVILPGLGGVVYWGRSIDINEIKQTGTYIYTRWP